MDELFTEERMESILIEEFFNTISMEMKKRELHDFVGLMAKMFTNEALIKFNLIDEMLKNQIPESTIETIIYKSMLPESAYKADDNFHKLYAKITLMQAKTLVKIRKSKPTYVM